MMITNDRTVRRVALVAYGVLLGLIVLWEAWLAPPTPVSRGFWLGLKALPLVVALPGLWQGKPRTYVLAALLMLVYFSLGVANVYDAAKHGSSLKLIVATTEILVSVIFIAAAPIYARLIWQRNSPALAGKES